MTRIHPQPTTMLSPRASIASSSVLTPTRITKSESVTNGTDATSAAKITSRQTGATPSQAASARPVRPARCSRRSSTRATHSSTPTGGISGASPGVPLHLLDRRGAEQTAGADQHHDDQDPEDDQVRERRGYVAGRERLGQPDEEAAEHRAGDVADAAQHRSRERLQAGREAHQVPDAVEDEAHHHAGRARQ